MKLFYVLLLSIFGLGQLVAQTDENAQYFDDGGLSNKKTTVKLNVAAVVTGDLPLSVERAFGDRFVLEAGAGILLPYYLREIPELIFPDEDLTDWITDPKSGYSFLIQPKFFLGEYPRGSYLGLQYRRRHFNMTEETVTFQSVTFNWGFQLPLGERLVMDYGFGLGFRGVTLDSETRSEPSELELAIPLIVKIGYLF